MRVALSQISVTIGVTKCFVAPSSVSVATHPAQGSWCMGRCGGAMLYWVFLCCAMFFCDGVEFRAFTESPPRHETTVGAAHSAEHGDHLASLKGSTILCPAEPSSRTGTPRRTLGRPRHPDIFHASCAQDAESARTRAQKRSTKLCPRSWMAGAPQMGEAVVAWSRTLVSPRIPSPASSYPDRVNVQTLPRRPKPFVSQSDQWTRASQGEGHCSKVSGWVAG